MTLDRIVNKINIDLSDNLTSDGDEIVYFFNKFVQKSVLRKITLINPNTNLAIHVLYS